MTGRVYIDLFTTLDGVAQAPGGQEEDPSSGFRYGGWQAPFPDEAIGASISKGISELDALLLGRRTYDIFAGYWPHQQGPIAEVLNRVPKYVASRGTPALDWAGTTQLDADVAAGIAQLRERHESIHVIGSIDFVQTLLREQLFDVLTLWVYPVVLGRGKKVFPDGAHPANVTLLEPAITGTLGVLQLRYGPAPGEPQTGEMGPEGPEG